MNGNGRRMLNVAINAVAMIGVLLIMLGLVWIMYYYTRPAPVDESRMAERRKNLVELNAQTQDVLDHYAWVDKPRGVVRLPIARAMDLIAAEWQQPAVARSNLLWRLDQAPPPPPPLPVATNSPSTTTNK